VLPIPILYMSIKQKQDQSSMEFIVLQEKSSGLMMLPLA